MKFPYGISYFERIITGGFYYCGSFALYYKKHLTVEISIHPDDALSSPGSLLSVWSYGVCM